MTDAPTEFSDHAERPSHRDLFTAFLKIGALGFGGVAPLARHVLVVERQMLDERGFAELFGFASTLPGANTVNLATMLGDRFRGPTGAATAVSGLLGAPLLFLIAIATIYARYAGDADVRAGVMGAAAAAAGLVGGTSLRLLRGLNPDIAAVLTATAVCLAAAVLKAPMLLILATATPISFALGLLQARRGR